MIGDSLSADIQGGNNALALMPSGTIPHHLENKTSKADYEELILIRLIEILNWQKVV